MGKQFFWKPLVVLCEHVGNNLMVSKLDYGLEKHCSRDRTRQITDKLDYQTKVLRTTTTIDCKLKRPVVKTEPLFYESVFREKNRAGNVGGRQSSAGQENRLATCRVRNRPKLLAT